MKLDGLQIVQINDGLQGGHIADEVIEEFNFNMEETLDINADKNGNFNIRR